MSDEYIVRYEDITLKRYTEINNLELARSGGYHIEYGTNKSKKYLNLNKRTVGFIKQSCYIR